MGKLEQERRLELRGEVKSELLYDIEIDGVNVFSLENQKVKVLAWSEWYEPTDGRIRHLTIDSKAE